MKQSKLLGYYNYTVVLTYIGMLTGFIGIVLAFEGNLFNSIICLMIAGFCDMFDGAIASTNKKRTEQEKCFGIQIDSLSDLICFGVLPASIVYSISDKNSIVLAISAMYVLSALIRLAYFNVDEQDRQKKCSGPRELYYGLPVTLSALIIPIVYGITTLFSLDMRIPVTVSLFVTGILFLLPFPLKKPKIIGKICVLVCGLVEVLLMVFVCLDV
ncbi:MAG: CDP-alcohol phosphatidyltransferase family protein [Lachnospiraceae bacterium]|nr:CDP-alcohol phosphatidyltransferase family protein [Lachnospiraceae bacterium]